MGDSKIQYLYISPKLLSLIGFGISQSYRQRLLRYYIISFLFLYLILVQFCQLATLDYNIQSILLVMQTLMGTMGFASIYCNCTLHYMAVQKVIKIVKQDSQQINDEREWMILRKHDHQFKLFKLFCGFMYSFYVCVVILPPILRKMLALDESRKTIDHFPIFSCLDYIVSPETYYYPIFIFQSMIVTLGIITCIECYSLFFLALQHICTLLSIIESKINFSIINNYFDDDVLAIPLDYSEWLIDIAKRLVKTRKMIKFVNTICNKVYLFQMFLACLLIVIDILCIPVLLRHNESKDDLFVFIIFIIGTIFMIYVNCYMGQRLLDYNMSVYKAMCLIPIHKISLKTQKLLLTMLIFSVKPIGLSIGKIFISSHEFFISLCRLAFSIAMVLHSI